MKAIENERICELWGKRCLEFTFFERECKIVFPEEKAKNGKWLLKTEYFSAFPAVEQAMLERGYHVAYIQNKSRWMLPEDIEAKEEFARLLSERFDLNKKCVTVGMSCGGLIATYFAAKHPERIAAMYLDAPVMNLLSCPAYVGRDASKNEGMMDELTRQTGRTLSDLINYRNHPIDNAPVLLENKIPIILVSGDSDSVVPYSENGLMLERLYKDGGGEIEVIIKKGGDHHPHGLDDPTPIIEFIEKHYK